MEERTEREAPPVRRDSADAPAGYLLLTTKLNVPSTRTNLVTRPRLLRRLDEGTRGRLTLVSAPAGFGKTTVLGDWIFRSELPVAWISLDQEDNDPARFLAYLVAALRTVGAATGEGETSTQSPNRAVLTELVNEIAAVPRDFALVLDDYHLIEDETVHATLAFLLEHLPPQMHLILASRTEPPLPLSRLLASGHLTKLTASDLRFTPEEAADFLNGAMGLDLPVEDVAALEERTEGWIAGLQLAALSMRGREDVSGFVSAFAGTNRHVFDYLAEEVLDGQSEDTRKFLLETSVLDRLSGSLCDAVTGWDHGQTTLEKLERMNLLMVPLDDARHWYRYHHLFSGFLRERLSQENPEMVSELHRRASAWHEGNGTASEAVGYALAAGDFERAGVMIEGLQESMTARGEVPTLEKMIKSLPERVLRSRPNLCNMYAITVLMPTGQWDAAEAWLRDAERMLLAGGEDFTRTRNEDLAMVIQARAMIAMDQGDTRGSITLHRRALEMFPDEKQTAIRGVAAVNLADSLLDIGDLAAAQVAIRETDEIGRAADAPSITAWSLCLLGQLQTIQGSLSEATRTYERVLRLAAGTAAAGALMETGVARVRMGELLLERNDLQAATCNLLEGIEMLLEWSRQGAGTILPLENTETHDPLGTPEEVQAEAVQDVATGYITLARVRQVQGDTEGAAEELRKAEQLARNSSMSPFWRKRMKTQVEAWRARLWIAEGNTRAANRWAQVPTLSARDDLVYSPESELEYLTLARLLIAQGDREEATKLLERLKEAAQAGGRGRTVIEVLILEARALRTRDDGPGALATLHRALMLAELEGYVRTFADEGEPMAELLRRLLRAWRKEQPGDVPLEYVSKLLEALGAEMTTPARARIQGPEDLILDPITGRELEVLRLLDSELSNREIAARLFVSIDTVKSHTRHLYAKLGVRARHQAVSRARELELL